MSDKHLAAEERRRHKHQSEMENFFHQAGHECANHKRNIGGLYAQYGSDTDMGELLAAGEQSHLVKTVKEVRGALADKRKHFIENFSFPTRDHALSLRPQMGRTLRSI